MDSRVIFEGAPPFELPAIQTAQADVLEDVVLMTLYAVLDGQAPGPVPIMAPMTSRVALALGHQLVAAGVAAEIKTQRP